MAYTLISHIAASSSDSNGFATSPIDTTGADLIVIATAFNHGTSISIADSNGNTWSALATQTSAGSAGTLYYTRATAVGAGHTFSVTGAATFPALAVAAFAGSKATSPLDQNTGTFANSGTTLAPGSITPAEGSELIITVNACNSNPNAIGSGFTLLDHLPVGGGTNFGVGLAYLIQTAAAAVNPTWTIAATTNQCLTIASFKAALAGGPNQGRGGIVGF